MLFSLSDLIIKAGVLDIGKITLSVRYLGSEVAMSL